MRDDSDRQVITVLDMDTGGDEPLSNHSDNPDFATILERRLSRRDVLAGGVGAAMVGFLGSAAFSPAEAHDGKNLPLPAKGRPAPVLNPKLGFDAIPASRSDTAVLPRGYRAQVLIPWGEPLTGSYPAYDGVNGNTGEEQEQQVGSHHDGMHYFPFPQDPNGHGLLCVNHEYVDQNVLHVKGPTLANGKRPTDEVRKEIAAHGVSIVEIRRSGRGRKRGDWEVVRGRHNRRITAGSPMLIGGPVRGSEFVRTKYSPKGLRARGTINNCAHGYTPWGTYLTCEENWAGYFVNRIQLTRIDRLFDALYGAGPASEFSGAYYLRRYPGFVVGVTDETFDQKLTSVVYRQDGSVLTNEGRSRVGTLDELLAQQNIVINLPREQARYGVPTTNGRYRWDTADSGEDQYVRFDASVKAADPRDDYRNEPNTQGWIVEIDPFNPRSMPVKRTALGRFAHEGCVFAPPRIGEQLAFYMGDDAQNEYIYKFVTRAAYRPNLRGDVLDEGTLYVARFNEDGSGDWLALDIRSQAFRDAAAAKGVSFKDQADVLVNTRLAADVVGATKMDRPEWGAVHPQTREVYMTLTNNSSRTVANAANPRVANANGHIIRWSEEQGRAAATRFTWDIFVLAGPANNSQVLPAEGGPPLNADNIFASPDGLWIDDNGILWIQTDMSGSQQSAGPFGENQMLAANPVTGEIRRFLTGPRDQETTGVVTTPDGRTMFVNLQHPGDRSAPGNFTSNWPAVPYQTAGDPPVAPDPKGARPRSATIVITRDDGGVIGL
jgi:secreted PhoX family phosphatase